MRKLCHKFTGESFNVSTVNFSVMNLHDAIGVMLMFEPNVSGACWTKLTTKLNTLKTFCVI